MPHSQCTGGDIYCFFSPETLKLHKAGILTAISMNRTAKPCLKVTQHSWNSKPCALCWWYSTQEKYMYGWSRFNSKQWRRKITKLTAHTFTYIHINRYLRQGNMLTGNYHQGNTFTWKPEHVLVHILVTTWLFTECAWSQPRRTYLHYTRICLTDHKSVLPPQGTFTLTGNINIFPLEGSGYTSTNQF